MISTETPPVTQSGSPEIRGDTPMEKAFWKQYGLYEGMKEIDMLKSSHGRAFKLGWDAAMGNKNDRS